MMGGPGSGNFYHWWRPPKRATVESCLSLDVAFLVRNRFLAADECHSGSLRWGADATGPSVSVAVDARDDRPTLTLSYRIRNHPGPELHYDVPLATTRPRFGGVRWWLVCPVVGCGRRAAKLHLPPGGRHFACRRCHRLTYASSQESGRYDALFRRLAAGMGADPRDVKRAWTRIGKGL
jgi:hypothetical protein